MLQFGWAHFYSDDPPHESGLTHCQNPLFKSGSKACLRCHFAIQFCSGLSSCLSFGEVVGWPTVKIGVKPTPKPTFWQWVDPPAQQGHFEQTNIQPKGSLSSSWPIFWGSMNLSHFALARDLLKHIDEEVPTHFSRVGRISGCIRIINIPQTSNTYRCIIMSERLPDKPELHQLIAEKRRRLHSHDTALSTTKVQTKQRTWLLNQ